MRVKLLIFFLKENTQYPTWKCTVHMKHNLGKGKELVLSALYKSLGLAIIYYCHIVMTYPYFAVCRNWQRKQGRCHFPDDGYIFSSHIYFTPYTLPHYHFVLMGLELSLHKLYMITPFWPQQLSFTLQGGHVVVQWDLLDHVFYSNTVKHHNTHDMRPVLCYHVFYFSDTLDIDKICAFWTQGL